MSETLKVRRVGDSLGLILPRPTLEELGAEEGDELFLVRDGEGGIRLTPHDPDFAEAVEDARAFMQSHQDAFQELAK